MSALLKRPLKILQGSTFSEIVLWKSGVVPVPVDLTGCTARMQMRADIDSTVALKTFTTENGGIVLGGTAGTIEYAKLSAEETAAITWEEAVYDLEIVFADGSVQRKIFGTVSVSREITRV